MIVFCVLICVASSIISYRIYNRFFNPIILFCMPLTICACLACSGFYGIYRPSEIALSYIVIAISSFTLGVALVSRVNKKNLIVCPVSLINNFSSVDIVQKWLFTALLSLATLSCIPYLIKTLPILMESGLVTLKFEYANGIGATLFTTRELLFFNWIILPIFNLAFLVFGYSLSQLKINVPALLFSILGITITICISGGRNQLFVFLVLVCMSVLMSPFYKSIGKYVRELPNIIKFVAVIGVFVLIYITQKRSLSSETSVLGNVFFYFAGAITYFSQILENPQIFDLDGNLLYGTALFGFITNPIEILTALISGGNVRGSENIISTSASIYLNFSDSLSGNALCTCLYPFMRDFGLFGVFLGPLAYGAGSAFVWKKWIGAFEIGSEAERQRWFMVTAYLSYCLLFSVWRYVPLFASTGIILLLIFIFTSQSHGHLNRICKN